MRSIKQALGALLCICMLCQLAGCKPQEAKPSETDPSTEATLAPTESQPKPTEPTESPIEPTQPPTEPTQPPTEPTEPPVEIPEDPTVEELEGRVIQLSELLCKVNKAGPIQKAEGYTSNANVPVWSIPKAEQRYVGKTFQVYMGKEQDEYCFLYRKGNGKEYLAVVLEEKIPLMLVMEVSVGGVKQMYEAIANGEAIQAKILSATNVTWEEVQDLRYQNWQGAELQEKAEGLDEGNLMGRIGSSRYAEIMGLENTQPKESPSFQMCAGDLSMNPYEYSKMLRRYGLENFTKPGEPIQELPEPYPSDREILDTFNVLFDPWNGWYNRVVGTGYDRPEDIRLYFFFHCGFDGEKGNPTDAEWAQLKDKPGFNENYEFFRLPVNKMNAVLQEFFGLSVSDMNKDSFIGLTYLESTDCYYFMATGAEGIASQFEAHSYRVMLDGTILLRYTAWGNPVLYEVGFIPYGDGYRFLFNRLAA